MKKVYIFRVLTAVILTSIVSFDIVAILCDKKNMDVEFLIITGIIMNIAAISQVIVFWECTFPKKN